MLSENCYVVSDESHECAIIDCGAYYREEQEAISRYIESHQLRPVRLLCTHAHFDHCFGNGFVYERYGLQPQVHADDAFLMDKMVAQTADIMGTTLPVDVPPYQTFLPALPPVTFGNHSLQIIHTPGHTPGGVSFYCKEEQAVFTGDTLFRMSIGRTDFEGGSYEQMRHSLSCVLALLPPQTRVYPGHGPESLIGEELRYNPYMR